MPDVPEDVMVTCLFDRVVEALLGERELLAVRVPAKSHSTVKSQSAFKRHSIGNKVNFAGVTRALQCRRWCQKVHLAGAQFSEIDIQHVMRTLRCTETGSSFHQPSERDQITISGPRYLLALAGIRRRVVQIKAIEKNDLLPIWGLVVRLMDFEIAYLQA